MATLYAGHMQWNICAKRRTSEYSEPHDHRSLFKLPVLEARQMLALPAKTSFADMEQSGRFSRRIP